MKRRPEALEEGSFDVIVVGGGILGACAAWDASLRGLSTALLEAEDFGGEASANNLKILHGGLRYLQGAQIRRSRESIRERRFWLQAAPHLAEPLPVIVPSRSGSARSRPLLRAAMAANDLLSADRNRDVEADRSIPRGRTLDRSEVLDRVPELAGPGLSGGALFHDALMVSPERLVLEVVLAAVRSGAVAVNYVTVHSGLWEGGRLAGVVARDALGGGEIRVRGRSVVNAAGSGAEAVASGLLATGGAGTPAAHGARIAPGWSSAVNVVVDALGHRDAFALPTKEGILFAVPWQGRTLVGTGHYPLPSPLPARPGEPPPEEWRTAARRDALRRFLDRLETIWPGISERMRLVHWGLLPTRGRPRGEGQDLLPRPRIVDHGRDGVPGAFSAVGVKFTTGRRAAERAVDAVCRWLGHAAPGVTGESPLPGTPPAGFRALEEEAFRRHAGLEVDEELLAGLLRSHGARYERVLSLRGEDPRWSEPVTRASNVVRAQFLQGAREEMAVTAEDLVWRRSLVGPRGDVSEGALKAARDALRRARPGSAAPGSGSPSDRPSPSGNRRSGPTSGFAEGT